MDRQHALQTLPSCGSLAIADELFLFGIAQFCVFYGIWRKVSHNTKVRTSGVAPPIHASCLLR